MATEDQLIAGLKAADAAGNTADAQHFADAIKALRASAPSEDDKQLDADIQRTHGEGAIPTFARGVIQGATANFGDEIVAGAKAATEPLLGGGSKAPTFAQRYNENVANEREQLAIDAKNNPISDIAGNIAGVVAGPGKLMKDAKGVVGMLRQGAVSGAIYGAGAGEGSLQNRAVSAGEGALMGGATGALFGGGTAAFNKLRPANLSANFVNQQFAKSPMAADSAKLSQDLGQVYTPGQATGSRSLLTIEGLVRRHPVSADTMADFDAKQLDTSLRNLTNNLDRLHANPAGPEATGGLVAKSFDDVLQKAINTRRATANADFGKVDQLAGGYRVIQPDNLKAEIDQIAKDYDVPGGGDASAALVRQIKGIATDIDRAGPKGMSATETQRLLEVYGKAANGTGKIFADMDTAQQRGIARRLQNAVLADVDAAANKGGHVGDIANALKTARDNYRSNSQAIDELGDSVLGRMFGGDYQKAPERVAQAMKNMQPSELRQSMRILNRANPDTSQAVKRYLVEDALGQAGVNPRSGAPQPQIAGQDTFSAAKFLTAMRKSNVWSSLAPQERTGMEQAMRDLERVSFRAGTDGSPTAPLQMALSLLSNRAGRAAGGAALGSGIALLSGGDVKEGAAAGALGGGLGGIAIPRIAKLITTPQGQQALRTIRTAKPNSRAAMAATSVLAQMFLANDSGQGKEARQ